MVALPGVIIGDHARCYVWDCSERSKHEHLLRNLVGKSGRNSLEFRNFSDSRPFELWNFHWNFIFPIVKFVLANLEHIPPSSESSPTINSSFFMHRKMFPLFLIVASKIVTPRVASKFKTQCTNTYARTIANHTHAIYPIHTNQ
jgi:hypothetical protein